MIFPVKADIIGFLEQSTASLQPFAKAHLVKLEIVSAVHTMEALYQPDLILADFVKLLCRIITFTPQNRSVNVRLEKCARDQDCLHISIKNLGPNLSLLGDITTGLHYDVNCICLSGIGSCFNLHIPLNPKIENSSSPPGNHEIIPPWYAEIRKRLTTHFRNIENLQKAAHEKGPNEGIFLQKVNAVIERNIDNEAFKTPDLAAAMALSRTQLFRRLKALTQMSPSNYLRFVRLERAKKMLESGEENVSEVAYAVGFVSASHFTRAFANQFGFNPSGHQKRAKS